MVYVPDGNSLLLAKDACVLWEKHKIFSIEENSLKKLPDELISLQFFAGTKVIFYFYEFQGRKLSIRYRLSLSQKPFSSQSSRIFRDCFHDQKLD
jgi:hypothetical protein